MSTRARKPAAADGGTGLIRVPGIPPSVEILADLRKSSDTIMLAFSCGKDALGAFLQCRMAGFSVVPYFMEVVPGLEFVNESLDYFEKVLACHIIRLPHPSFYRMLRNLVFQPPERCAILEAAEIVPIDYEDVRQAVIAQSGLSQDVFVANGVRACDSIMRRVAIIKHSPLNFREHKVNAVWDWRKSKIMAEIAAAGIRLPVDYEMFGRTFDGIDWRFLAPIKERYPADYRKILDWFPLADLEIFRRTLKGSKARGKAK